MAIYHAQVKTFSRAKGRSSVAAAAYRAGLLLLDERTGLKHDYRVRRGVVESRVVVPHDAPEWSTAPARLWAAAEAAERRKDATVAREFEVALPHELDDLQRSRLAADLARTLVERYGFAAQASIHAPPVPEGLNHHVHILATTRRLSPTGMAGKTRELDGGPSGKAEVEWVREMVAKTINRHLEAAAVGARVDHRSLAAQADDALDRGDVKTAIVLTREPMRHVGKDAMAAYRKGSRVEAIEENNVRRIANQRQTEEGLREWARMRRGSNAGLPDVLLSRSGGDSIQVVRGLAPARPTLPQHEQREAAAGAFKEAHDLWSEPFRTRFDHGLVLTARVLKNAAERIAVHVGRPHFFLHIRNLVRRLQRLRDDANEAGRRKFNLAYATRATQRAEQELERFDRANPRPATWSKPGWAQRRLRHLQAVEARRSAYQAACRAGDVQALADCEVRAAASAEEVEAWSKTLLERYPTPQDALDARAAAPARPQPPLPPVARAEQAAEGGRGALGRRRPRALG